MFAPWPAAPGFLLSSVTATPSSLVAWGTVLPDGLTRVSSRSLLRCSPSTPPLVT